MSQQLQDLKAQTAAKRFTELRALGGMAKRKAYAALQTEIAASSDFIRAVVELSGTAPDLTAGG